MSKKLISVSLIALGAFVGGCPENSTGDASSDVTHPDVQSTDGPTSDVVSSDTVPPSDVQSDVVTADASDGAPGDGAPGDGGACTGTGNPFNAFGVRQMTTAFNGDFSGIGGAASVNMLGTGGLRAAPDSTAADGTLEGSCFATNSQFGSTARTMAAIVDYGRLTVAQGSQSLVFDYSSAMGAYGRNTGLTTLTDLMPGTSTTLTVMGGAGGDGGVAGMLTLTSPPRPTITTFTLPTMISRSTPTTIPFTPPAGASADVYAVLLGSGATGAPYFGCVVPACAGQFVVPASMLAHFNAGDEVDLQPGFLTFGTVPPTTRTTPLVFGLEQLTSGAATAM